MRLLSIVGKVAFLVFWLAVLANLLEPFAYPFQPVSYTHLTLPTIYSV